MRDARFDKVLCHFPQQVLSQRASATLGEAHKLDEVFRGLVLPVLLQMSYVGVTVRSRIRLGNYSIAHRARNPNQPWLVFA
jgi:hypothetical protein